MPFAAGPVGATAAMSEPTANAASTDSTNAPTTSSGCVGASTPTTTTPSTNASSAATSSAARLTATCATSTRVGGTGVVDNRRSTPRWRYVAIVVGNVVNAT